MQSIRMGTRHAIRGLVEAGWTRQEQLERVWDRVAYATRNSKGALSLDRALALSSGRLHAYACALERLIKAENGPEKTPATSEE